MPRLQSYSGNMRIRRSHIVVHDSVPDLVVGTIVRACEDTEKHRYGFYASTEIELSPELSWAVFQAVMPRIAEWLQLPDDAKRIMLSLTKGPKEKDLLSVFADWLEDQNRPAEAAKVRKAAG